MKIVSINHKRVMFTMKKARYWLTKKELGMNTLRGVCFLIAAVLGSVSVVAHESNLAAPQLVLKQSVADMPKGNMQEVRVLTASFKPGDRTVFHTHRSPVTVYILEGAFTLELEGREPVTIKAGQAYVEPPNVKMTGYNRSSTDALRLAIFYVSDPDTPFLDVVQ
jgi:quercetin dioxygenase-like cupin family protein